MTSTERPLRIVLAEDSPLLRAGVESVLASAGHDVCAAVGDAPTLLHAWEAYRPDLVVTDVRMRATNTTTGCGRPPRYGSAEPALPIVVLSQYVSVAYLDEL
ncbi:response regulator, partial [Rhodococcus hoagii]|nr:response regulator [Prescottella equi]